MTIIGLESQTSDRKVPGKKGFFLAAAASRLRPNEPESDTYLTMMSRLIEFTWRKGLLGGW